MKLIDLIRKTSRLKQPSKKQLKIRIKTDKNGKVEIYDQDTGQRLTNILRINLFVNSLGRICAEITIKDVELDIQTKDVTVRNEDTNRNDRATSNRFN